MSPRGEKEAHTTPGCAMVQRSAGAAAGSTTSYTSTASLLVIATSLPSSERGQMPLLASKPVLTGTSEGGGVAGSARAPPPATGAPAAKNCVCTWSLVRSSSCSGGGAGTARAAARESAALPPAAGDEGALAMIEMARREKIKFFAIFCLLVGFGAVGRR